MANNRQGDRTRLDRRTNKVRTKAALAAAIVVLALTGFWIEGPAGAQDTATISVLVLNSNGPAPDVQVDLFASDESGQRLGWIRSQTTGQGPTEFVVPPGCYVTTAIAPGPRQFTNGSQWSSRADCVQPGGIATAITQFADPSNLGQVSGYARQGANPVSEMSIGVFEASADGGRGQWLRDVQTGSHGDYETLLSPGCYMLTSVAPTDEDVFENTGTPWDNQPFCLEDGEQRSINFSVLATSISRLQVLVVDFDFEAVRDVQVDLYVSDPHGLTRVEWVESTVTDADGLGGFDVGGGCWVLTAIAPNGRTFVESGTQWAHHVNCLSGPGFVIDPTFIQLAG